MWYDALEPGRQWSTLWSGYIVCGNCSAIRKIQEPCPACTGPAYSTEPETMRLADGREFTVMPTFAGAEGRYEDYVYLRLLEREWKRPLTDADAMPASNLGGHLSPRASIVILYWSYFETRIDRLVCAGMRGVPLRLVNDTLQRYSAVGARMDRLYRVLFDSTYRNDLNDLGYERIGEHLAEVQRSRNEFAHGNPTAISDGLVQAVVENLKDEHEAWITVFNRRGTQRHESM